LCDRQLELPRERTGRLGVRVPFSNNCQLAVCGWGRAGRKKVEREMRATEREKMATPRWRDGGRLSMRWRMAANERGGAGGWLLLWWLWTGSDTDVCSHCGTGKLVKPRNCSGRPHGCRRGGKNLSDDDEVLGERRGQVEGEHVLAPLLWFVVYGLQWLIVYGLQL